MNITLTKELEKFVAGKVRSGGFSNPDAVVRAALREFRAKHDPAGSDSKELAALLLPAVRGPHRPLTSRHFSQLRQRARQKPARA